MELPQFPSRPTCTACELHALVRSVGVPSSWVEGTLTPGVGIPAVIMLGQNPGLQEDMANAPFIGPSGKLVRTVYIPPSVRSLASFYLFNTARCFEPKPKQRHYNACFNHTIEDLKEVIKCHGITTFLSSSLFPSSPTTSSPSFSSGGKLAIMSLGLPATTTLLKHLRGKGVSSMAEALKLQGTPIQFSETTLTLFTSYHPAFILRKPPVVHAVKDHIILMGEWLQGRIAVPSKPTIQKAAPP